MAQMKEFEQAFPMENFPELKTAKFEFIGASAAIRFADIAHPTVRKCMSDEDRDDVFEIGNDDRGNYIFREMPDDYLDPDHILYLDTATRMLEDQHDILISHYSYNIGPDPRKVDFARSLTLILPALHEARFLAVSSHGTISVEGGQVRAMNLFSRSGDIAIKDTFIDNPPRARSIRGNVSCENTQTKGNFTVESPEGRIFISESEAFKWILRSKRKDGIHFADNVKGRVDRGFTI